jgi:excisionase family DNA binding protein
MTKPKTRPQGARKKASAKIRQAEALVRSERVKKQLQTVLSHMQKEKRPVLTSRFQNEDVPVGGFKNKDAARYLNVSVWTLARLVQRGLIRANRATRHYLYSKEELDRFLREGMV